LDIEGNQRAVRDATQQAGNPIRAWDSRGHNVTIAYDALRRPVRQTVRGTAPTPTRARSTTKTASRREQRCSLWQQIRHLLPY
jgi:YD repeat-containing protein